MIEPFPWSDAFAVGDDRLDDEHRRMVDLINQVCTSVIIEQHDKKASLLNELLAISEVHFRHEEALLVKVATEIDQHHLRTTVLTAIEAHADEHGRGLEALREIVEKSRAARVHADELKHCEEMKAWFIDHTIGYETQVKTILQSSRHLRPVS